jgi:antirestriction protein ArdC
MNTYDIITNRILAKMQQGQVPWRKPWTFQRPVNLVSQRPYHGINLLLLTMSEYETPYWLTFKQAQELGGTIKKGEHGTPVIFWKLLEVLDDTLEEGTEVKAKTIPYLQYSTVFNLSQIEGIERPEDTKPAREPLTACEAIITGFVDKPATIHTLEPRAYYKPATDTVHMPVKSSFISPEEYYTSDGQKVRFLW